MIFFIECTVKKNWRDGDDRHYQEFWENQKDEYLEHNPSHHGLFVEDVNSFEEGYI